MANVLVNATKAKRAKDILDFLDGEINTCEEVVLAGKMKVFLKQDKVDKDDRLEYIYTKLGGLVRTEAEQTAAEKKAEKIRLANEKKGKVADVEEDE